MDNISYKKIVKRHIKKDNYLLNYIIAFLSGGLMGVISQCAYLVLRNIFNISSVSAISYISVFIIFILWGFLSYFPLRLMFRKC